ASGMPHNSAASKARVLAVVLRRGACAFRALLFPAPPAAEGSEPVRCPAGLPAPWQRKSPPLPAILRPDAAAPLPAIPPLAANSPALFVWRVSGLLRDQSWKPVAKRCPRPPWLPVVSLLPAKLGLFPRTAAPSAGFAAVSARYSPFPAARARSDCWNRAESPGAPGPGPRQISPASKTAVIVPEFLSPTAFAALCRPGPGPAARLPSTDSVPLATCTTSSPEPLPVPSGNPECVCSAAPGPDCR